MGTLEGWNRDLTLHNINLGWQVILHVTEQLGDGWGSCWGSLRLTSLFMLSLAESLVFNACHYDCVWKLQIVFLLLKHGAQQRILENALKEHSWETTYMRWNVSPILWCLHAVIIQKQDKSGKLRWASWYRSFIIYQSGAMSMLEAWLPAAGYKTFLLNYKRHFGMSDLSCNLAASPNWCDWFNP